MHLGVLVLVCGAMKVEAPRVRRRPPRPREVADLEREPVLVGGKAVNFWASFYEGRLPELAREATRPLGSTLLRSTQRRSPLRSWTTLARRLA